MIPYRTLCLASALLVLVVASVPLPGHVSRASEQASVPAQPPAAGPVVARVSFAGQADLNRLASALDVWEVHHAGGYLVALLRPDQVTALL